MTFFKDSFLRLVSKIFYVYKKEKNNIVYEFVWKKYFAFLLINVYKNDSIVMICCMHIKFIEQTYLSYDDFWRIDNSLKSSHISWSLVSSFRICCLAHSLHIGSWSSHVLQKNFFSLDCFFRHSHREHRLTFWLCLYCLQLEK